MLRSPPQRGSSADHDVDYYVHIREHDVPTGIGTDRASPVTGHRACNDLRNGHDGASEVLHIANGGHGGIFTLPQAEMIVYWAIADLCPDQAAQSQDHWRDGH